MTSMLGIHVNFGTYGFWLPNDPRGSPLIDRTFFIEVSRLGPGEAAADIAAIDQAQGQNVVLASGADGGALLDELVVGAARAGDGAGDSGNAVRDCFGGRFRQRIAALRAMAFLRVITNIRAIGRAKARSIVGADSLAEGTGVADGQVLLEHKIMMNEER